MTRKNFVLWFKKLSHNQIRYLLLPFLALALVHFVTYGKLPWDEGYQFPAVPFLSVLLVCVICCEANTLSYSRLSKKFNFDDNVLRTIAIQMGVSLALTTIIFAISVYSLNYIIFGYVAGLSRFLSSLFIALLIISVETLIYIIRDLKRVNIDNRHLNDSPITINTFGRTLSISLEEIAYIFSQKGLVYIVKRDGDKVLTQFNSLNELTSQYPFEHFFKLNRQFMVSPFAIESIRKDINQKLKVNLQPETSNIPNEAIVSRYTSPSFKKWMSQ